MELVTSVKKRKDFEEGSSPHTWTIVDKDELYTIFKILIFYKYRRVGSHSMFSLAAAYSINNRIVIDNRYVFNFLNNQRQTEPNPLSICPYKCQVELQYCLSDNQEVS